MFNYQLTRRSQSAPTFRLLGTTSGMTLFKGKEIIPLLSEDHIRSIVEEMIEVSSIVNNKSIINHFMTWMTARE
jgi:hypothetical protein